jgi:hypothetical protein
MTKTIWTILPILFLWMCLIGVRWEKEFVVTAMFAVSLWGVWEYFRYEWSSKYSLYWGIFFGFLISAFLTSLSTITQ